MKKLLNIVSFLALFILPGILSAQEANDVLATVTEAAEAVAETAELSSSNTAWMLTATVLVLFMTLPGLALFYG
ncbi:MAG: hypothetical protein NWS00_00840, partial [Opitutales bacterium]|nr:hypothetical protein [Opitutales bacterium]